MSIAFQFKPDPDAASPLYMQLAHKLAQAIREGVYHALNHRTSQRLPLYYQMYQDFLAHENAYDTSRALANLNIPMLILHGTNDGSIHHDAAHRIHQSYPDAELHLLPGADHSFGMMHPYTATTLPADTEKLLDLSIDFLNRVFPD